MIIALTIEPRHQLVFGVDRIRTQISLAVQQETLETLLIKLIGSHLK
jgi:hypothetical protein